METNTYFLEVIANHSEVAESIAQIRGIRFDECVSEYRDAKTRTGQRMFQINVVELSLTDTKQIINKWTKSVKVYREEKEEKSEDRTGRSLLIEVDKKDLTGAYRKLKAEKLKGSTGSRLRLKNA